MDYVPQYFQEVALGTYEQTQCSPAAPSPQWSGVAIVAPERIQPRAREAAIVPVCGYFVVAVLAAMDGPPLTVHVRRVNSKEVLSGEIAEEGANEPVDPPPPEAPRPSRESFAGVTVDGYFNIDAQRYLPARLTPGTYEIATTYAGAKSNVVQVTISAP
ncbi:hypothetical protein [uncultured Thiodictyon sp.]|uniref:hypothetical protein n=1 Tax=uncultured Thiodictyon sp. TaxID=1846217 RepID=UPI0025CE6885|nr:hypothetical protein [uncultured Thiodictyon sp.]